MIQLRSLLLAVMVVCSIALSSCDRSGDQKSAAESLQHANQVLKGIKLPVLPEGVTDARCWTGGIFAKYVNVKFAASPDQALEYVRSSGAGFYYEFRINGTGYHIVASHSLGGTPGTGDETDLHMLVGKSGIIAEPWFKTVYDIRHGWAYYYSADWPARYHMFYDVDSQQFYIYWCYS